MSRIYRLGLSDDFTGQYRDVRTFVEQLLSRLLLEARALGWAAARLHDADWTDGDDKNIGAWLAIQIEPGEADATVDDVRELLREKRRKAA